MDLQNAGDNTPIDPHSVEPTPKASEDEQPEARNSAPTTPTVEPTPEKPKDESTRTQSTLNPEATVKPTSKPQRTPSATQPSATLEIVLPTLAPEPTQKPTAKPTTKKSTESRTSSPEPPPPTKRNYAAGRTARAARKRQTARCGNIRTQRTCAHRSWTLSIRRRQPTALCPAALIQGFAASLK